MAEFDTVYIKSSAKQHGYSLALYSGIGFVLSLLLFIQFSHLAELPLLFLMMCSVVAFVVALFKLQEPDLSFMLNNQGILYHHKRGFMLVEWSNIRRIGIPTVQHGLEQKELAYIGVNLIDSEKILSAVSLRLISHLLMEQRAILHKYLLVDCPTGTCPSEITLNTDPYKSSSGQVYKGLRGMFAHRMDWLKKLSGYDLLIPETAFDRSSDEFAKLLRQYKSEAEKFENS
ncbi:hypothetical protein DS2_00355 [Catenovulum agarivorans DS-2]|uniref:DUF2982 domain-containing protein n=1 Tax=Catenovulum agarivorans DS-2 TaxID=1328313 RepID=W7QWL5_9ALTE|nr:DUF2982 domain-containing protein [Catenovulum agarivorans]EWH12128.1 hypothetical protein DS2_00355 [Catenovulum agarivorans DS-2]